MQINLWEEFGISNTMSRDEIDNQIKVLLQKYISWKNHPNFEKQKKADDYISVLQRIKKCVDENAENKTVKDIINTIQNAIDDNAFSESFEFDYFYNNNKYRIKKTKSNDSNKRKSRDVRNNRKELALGLLDNNWVLSYLVLFVAFFWIYIIEVNKNINTNIVYIDAVKTITILWSVLSITVIMACHEKTICKYGDMRTQKIFSNIRCLVDTASCLWMVCSSIYIFINRMGDMGLNWFHNVFDIWGAKFVDTFELVTFDIFFLLLIGIPFFGAFLVAPLISGFFCLRALVHVWREN